MRYYIHYDWLAGWLAGWLFGCLAEISAITAPRDLKLVLKESCYTVGEPNHIHFDRTYCGRWQFKELILYGENQQTNLQMFTEMMKFVNFKTHVSVMR